MPAIQTELRVQLDGGRSLPVQRTSMNVDSYEEFSFTVPGVPPSAPVKVVLPTTTKANKTELIGGSSAGTRSAASATKNAAARASRPKGKVRGKKKKKK